ncbi:hypothetical protein SAMN02745664_11430 [Moraxella cuniculi DSM 21768]|uniref:Uncharacterized protein n=2 Tax=Moraxella cuniculi TaxID=34061 RepID=A0A1N7FM05_9GAMM|nr:hypothetical protein [Moraxella cuniculi]OOS05718.1 hypothetical protein B0189_06235 [Moraxella cuniculi]SIS01314.1 hypothetical protein SAMN02745664_11430 [Moraxella cuniculi DSM 21768]VEG13299.1 Uncharacterised protein [Moraxella cuniculi]
MLDKLIPDAITPDGIPKGLILLLVVACLLIGLAGLRYGGWEGWLHTFENWLICLIIIPACTALVAAPLKWRDDSFDIKMAYYLGMFVALLFMIAKLRYWR